MVRVMSATFSCVSRGRRFARRLFVGVATAMSMSGAAEAQLDIASGINDVIQTVNEGIDLIWPNDLKIEGLSARLGPGIGFTPDYEGSDNYRLRVLPIIDVRYKERWRLNGSLLTYAAIKNGAFEAGPLLHLRFGRPENRNPILRGLREIDTTFQTGVFARYQTQSGLVSLNYRHALSEGIGGSLDFTAGHGVYKNGNFVTILGLRGRWLSKKAMQRNFGVTIEEAARSEAGLPAFATNSGFSDISANVVGAYRLSDRVRLLSLFSVGHLLSDARRSPLVQGDVGSSLQLVFGVGFTSQF